MKIVIRKEFSLNSNFLIRVGCKELIPLSNRIFQILKFRFSYHCKLDRGRKDQIHAILLGRRCDFLAPLALNIYEARKCFTY